MSPLLLQSIQAQDFYSHMTSQVTGSGKHKREEAICSMESTKDDSTLKARFFAVRKEIYNR